MAPIAYLQHEIDVRLRSGEPLRQVEHDLIEPSDLTEEDKSVLWLYGWACLETVRFSTSRARKAFIG